jgi:hypothetical protein
MTITGIPIEDYPPIRRYFPDCFWSTIESALKFQYQHREFDRVFGFHTFHYQRGQDINVDPQTTDLNLYFGRDESWLPHIPKFVKRHHRVKIKQKKARSIKDFQKILREKLERREPVVSDFNLGFIRESRKYGQSYEHHYIAIIAIEEGTGTMIAAEQDYNIINIPHDDFIAGLERNIRQFRCVNYYVATPKHPTPAPIKKKTARLIVDHNLGNLNSNDGNSGLQALDLFRADLEAFVSDYHHQQPFHIPGLWSHGHERFMLGPFIKAIVEDLNLDVPGDFIPNTEALFDDLHKKWFAIDMLIEKNYIRFKKKNLDRIVAILSDISRLEARAADLWGQIKNRLDRRPF